MHRGIGARGRGRVCGVSAGSCACGVWEIGFEEKEGAMVMWRGRKGGRGGRGGGKGREGRERGEKGRNMECSGMCNEMDDCM